MNSLNEIISVRQANSRDLYMIGNIDMSNTTDYVWQMDFKEEDKNISIVFRRTRLPRSIDLDFTELIQNLDKQIHQFSVVLVAESLGRLCGFVAIDKDISQESGTITLFAVDKRMRRKGIATSMLAAAKEWCIRLGLNRLIIVTQSRNYPSISFCVSNGYSYCGYNDSYYSNQDIAVFFSMRLY